MKQRKHVVAPRVGRKVERVAQRPLPRRRRLRKVSRHRDHREPAVLDLGGRLCDERVAVVGEAERVERRAARVVGRAFSMGFFRILVLNLV